MNPNQFDAIARALATRSSRRTTIGAATGVTAAGLLAHPSGWLQSVLAQTAGGPVVDGKPKLRFEPTMAVLTFTSSEVVACDLEYGPTKELGQISHSDDIGTEHEISFGPLDVGQRYYFRLVMISGDTEVRTKLRKFTFTGCSAPNLICNGRCLAPCPDGLSFNEATCTCSCPPGKASCDGDSANGCETDITSPDNCLACGNRCDDGNACTEDYCDPTSGCASRPLTNGTPCSAAGVCIDGACVNCLEGGSCSADRDCCDNEVCCGGTCVDRGQMDTDPDNCGACGNQCPSTTCEQAICDAGICRSTASENGIACETVDPCQADGACSNGACIGVRIADGTPCGDGGICSGGTCQDCKTGGPCSVDGSCCGDLTCCDGLCVDPAGFDSDQDNCGGCGVTCAEENPCLEHQHCMSGECMGNPVEDGMPCGETGTCQAGSCVDCLGGQECSGDTDCCANEMCCDDRCITIDSLNTDSENCGACGLVCETDKICQVAVCEDGICSSTPEKDQTPCGDDGGICLDGECIAATRFSSAETGVLFSDDFESGNLSQWTSSSRMVVQQSLFAAGKNAARATGSGTTAYARKSLSTPQTNLYVRTRFRLVSQGSNSVYLVRTYRSSTSPLASVFVDKNGKLCTHNGVTGTVLTSTTAISRNVWYEIEMRTKISGTKSLSWVWLDGVRVEGISKTVDLGTNPISQFQIGDNVTKRTFDVVLDDVAACAGTFCPEPPPYERGYSTSPGADSGVMLRNYTFKGGPVKWEMLSYRPRQCVTGTIVQDPTRGELRIDAPGDYENWDVFPTLNYSLHKFATQTEWAIIELNRPATVGIAWRGGPAVPPWLASWTKRGTITVSGKQLPVYVNTAKAGTLKLGAVYEPGHPDATKQIHRDTYWVLLAEADGLPSPPPVVPGGSAIPIPNATCPTWVHDAYTKRAPDGKVYASWHQQIDAKYWCYHRHEHGSDPANFGSSTSELFGYVAAKHGMVEPHAGFKLRVFDDTAGRRWLLGLHMGTGGRKRACQRFHTVMIACKDLASGRILADIQFMADFGRSLTNGERLRYTPVDCPDQANAPDQEGSVGEREIPVGDRSGYESWTPDYSRTVFGLITRPSFKTDDPIVVCNSINCDTNHSRGSEDLGARHKMSLRNDRDTPFGINTYSAQRTGTFWTDPFGRTLRNETDPDAVRQYLAPGIQASATISGGHCFDVDGWGKLLQCGTEFTGFGDTAERENALLPPN